MGGGGCLQAGTHPRGPSPTREGAIFASIDGGEIDRLAASAPSWRDDLLLQARMLNVPPRLGCTVEQLILELDEDGLLRHPLEDLARRLPEDPGCLAKALALIQEMEPAGVGARTRQESLKLQWLRCYGSEGPLNRLGLALLELEPGSPEPLDFNGLASRLGATRDQIDLVLDRLRRMSLAPVMSTPPVCRIRPDLSVRLEGGSVRVEVREPEITLVIDPTYRSLARSDSLREEERSYLRRQMRIPAKSVAWIG